METELFEYFNTNILDSGKTIRVTSVSSEYDIDLNTCSEFLEKWLNVHKDNEFSTELLVSGLKTNGEIFLAVIKSEDFDNIKSQATIFKKTLFSVGKSTSGPTIEELNLTDLKHKTNPRYNTISESTHLVRTENEEEEKSIQKPEITNVKSETIKKEPIGSPIKPKDQKVEKEKSTLKENIQKSKNSKLGGANKKTSSITSFFTAKPANEKKPETLGNAIQTKAKDSNHVEKNNIIDGNETQKKTKRNLEGEKDAKITTKRRKLVGRKRVFVESSDGENSSNEEVGDDKEEADDPKERIIVMDESDSPNPVEDENNLDTVKEDDATEKESDNIQGNKNSFETVTYEDEDGYLVTMKKPKKEEPKPKTVSEKKPPPPPQTVKRSSPRKAAKSTAKPAEKQTSISSFFTRKN